MLSKKQKKYFKILLFEFALTAVFVLIAISAFGAMYRMYHKYSYAQNEKSKYQKQLDSIIERENKIKNKLEFLKSDFGKEYQLRTIYDFAKEGEKLIVIVEDQEPKTEKKQEKKQFWREFLEKIF